jgi:hypothetical protein
MKRRLFFLTFVVLVLGLSASSFAACFDTIASYELDEVGDINVLPTNPTDSPTLTVTWPVLGGVNDVPEATEGDYVLKLKWTNEADHKIEVRHDWSGFTFDLSGVAYILVDVYFATESALPAPEKKNISIWSHWDTNSDADWIKCESVPPTTNEWYTVAFYVGNLEYENLNHIAALTFEDMNGTDGTIYIDNLQLATESPDYPYQCPYFGRKIKFSGYNWSVPQSEWPIGVGPNFFTDDLNDVWIDQYGCLHLNIVYKEPNWYCSEIVGNKNLGYGTYIFTVKAREDLLDQNIVLGLFIYDVPDAEGNPREIDFELSRWWDQNEPDNAQYVVQPWDGPNNRYRFYVDEHKSVTHEITWTHNRIDFRSYYGDYPLEDPADLIKKWTYTGDDIPPAGCENPRMNLWLLPPKDSPVGTPGSPPSDGQEAEVIIKRFLYLPISIRATIDINPDSLNLASKGQWVTCLIRLGDGYNVSDIDSASVFLKDTIKAKWVWSSGRSQVATAVFNRSEVQQMLAGLNKLGDVELTVTGQLVDGTRFEGIDTIKVISPVKGKK